MKKMISFLLAIVLLISAMPMGAFTLGVSAACSNHVYTNACDVVCNECSSKREFVAHDYDECFYGCEENLKYLGEWEKTALKTGVFGIQPLADSESFTYHYLVVADESGSEVRFNENAKGWPMVSGQEYTIRLFCQYDDTPISDIDFNLVEITEAVFSDVDTSEWYNDSVIYNVGAGFITGYGGTDLFGTADNIQRQDFVVILARMAGIELKNYQSNTESFADVPSGEYYEKAILWAADCGITTGYNDGTNRFGVGDFITREQMVTFLYRYAKYTNDGTAPEVSADAEQKAQTYADYIGVTDYAKEAIIWALDKGVMSGREGMYIAPDGNALRCEVAQILYNNYLSGTIPTAKLCFHKYQAATCPASKICDLCGKIVGEGDHIYLDATCTTPKTCKECSKEIGVPLGHNYVLGECNRVNNGEICGDYSASYCPKFYFTGDMSNMNDKKDVRDITFEYRSRDQILTGAAKIKPQGTSSMAYAKKNFTINFYKDGSYAEKLGVNVGWGAQDEYCLKANWIDKTHSRNVVSAKLVGEMQAKYGLFENAPNGGAIDGFPVEVYINGQFHGLYTMNIPKDDWMFAMDDDNPNHIVICGENWNDPVKFLSVPTNLNDWAVEVGPEDDATLAKVQRLVDFVLNSNDEEFVTDFDQYLNLDATLNYYVMMTYGWMIDNAGKNMLLATYDGNVWYPSLYDLDTSWGTNWQGNGVYDYSEGFTNGSQSLLWQRMEKLYKKEIAERYFELRKDVLDPQHVMDMFSGFYESIPQEVIDRETQKWNTAETTIPGYDISQIQHYLDTVVPRLDARYNDWK